MNKITSLLALFLIALGINAQNPELILGKYKVSDDSNKYYYFIRGTVLSNSANKFAKVGTDKLEVLFDQPSTLSDEYYWYFEKGETENSYYIKNKVTGNLRMNKTHRQNWWEMEFNKMELYGDLFFFENKAVSKDVEETTGNWYTHTIDYVCIKNTNSNNEDVYLNQHSGASQLGYWRANDNNSTFEINPATAEAGFYEISTDENPVCYYIANFRTGNFMKLNDNNVGTQAFPDFDITEPTCSWYFTQGAKPGTFKIKNINNKDQAIGLNDSKRYVMKSLEESEDFYINSYMSYNSSKMTVSIGSSLLERGAEIFLNEYWDNSVGKWHMALSNYGDRGSAWYVYTEAEIQAKKQAVEDRLSVYVKELTDLSNDQVYNIFIDDRGYWAYRPEYVYNENGMGYFGEHMLASTDCKRWTDEDVQVPEDNKKFAILKSSNDNYYVYNIAAKKFVSAQTKPGRGGNDYNATFLSEKPLSPISITKGGLQSRHYAWIFKCDEEQISISNNYKMCGGIIVGYNKNNDPGNNLQIVKTGDSFTEKAEVLKLIEDFEAGVTVSVDFAKIYGDKFNGRPVGYDFACTFSSNVNRTIPKDVKAYYMAGISGETGSLVEIKNVIPANTGVVLLSKTPQALLEKTASVAPNVSGNLLGCNPVFAQRMSSSYYVLTALDGVMQFYKAKENALLANGKAYIKSLSNANFVNLKFEGETTGVENIETEDTGLNKVYDLSGRQVNQTVKGGVYIQNGKKFIVR